MNNDLEQFSEERLKQLASGKYAGTGLGIQNREVAPLARIALSVKQAKPVAYLYHYSTSDGQQQHLSVNEMDISQESVIKNKVEMKPLYTTPQPAHTEQSEMLNKAHGLSESIGELRKQIDSSGGYNFEAMRSEQVNSPVIPDGWRLVPIDPTQEMVDAHISGMQSAGFSRAYRDMLASAPKPDGTLISEGTKNDSCQWNRDEDSVYSTGCGNEWQFTDGGLEDNKIKFCPYCSGKIAAPKPESE